MDERDRKLLAILRSDGRRSIVALARDIHLSRSATQERLARLERSGAIKGYTLVEGGAGAEQSAYLSISFEPGYRCAQVVPKLKAIPGVTLVHSVTGTVDLIVRVDAQDVGAIEACRSAIAEIPGVGTVTTSMVLERHVG